MQTGTLRKDAKRCSPDDGPLLESFHLQSSLVSPWQSAGRPEKARIVILAKQMPMMVKSPGNEMMAKMRHDLSPSVLKTWTRHRTRVE